MARPQGHLIAGLTEVASYAGVQKQAVSQWVVRYDDFPQPLARLAAGPIWWLPEVHTWLLATGRKVDQNWTWAQVNASEITQRRKGRRRVRIT